ncbi:hypothetical protein H0H81_001449 [Sphagnurus paluster]|uniref:Uncharacterized protein n=1 Tax=Sphagnurus paluster TaxID=117069 RepID=A0A9P7K361_9AGAR|nr:hypothetical protein H0H81_001449 [Sphagnurus paluster]
MSVYKAKTPSNDHETLVKQLNALLSALQIPISLLSPTELTPSLLIAILESMLSTRIPQDNNVQTREIRNLQNIKIFLGVLETDVLRMDVGLSSLDPRKLANGGLEECVYVGELLCWVGRQLRYVIHDDPFEPDDLPTIHEHTRSPSTSTTTRQTFTNSNFSIQESNTSIESFRPSTPPPKSTPRKRCIHELPTPSLILSPTLDSSFNLEHGVSDQESPRRNPVRYTGYISPVDEELELLSFERSRSSSIRTTMDDSNDVRLSVPKGKCITHFYLIISVQTQSASTYSLFALRESRAHTLALYQERARLLEELARLENDHLHRS